MILLFIILEPTMATTERVTVTLPADLVENIDRLERNRSRFIKDAVQHEVARRRREGLLRSLEQPRSEAVDLADAGPDEWAESLPCPSSPDAIDHRRARHRRRTRIRTRRVELGARVLLVALLRGRDTHQPSLLEAEAGSPHPNAGGAGLAGGPPADWRRFRQLAAATSRNCWAATAACGLRGACAVSSQAGDAACATERRLGGYERRRPEQRLLYQLIEQHWPQFVERAEEQGGLPSFVVREFEEFLRCGILEHGLIHLACRHCGDEMVAAFSCKRRGFCPSCLGRRMADMASHLVDEVLPEVPIRQWVCSLPWRLRYAMGYDRRLCADVLRLFIDALRRSLRHRAKQQLGLRSVRDAQFGALTFVQRADSALRLNPHFHILCLDGVYVRDEHGVLQFHPLGEPTAEEVAQVAAWTHAGLLRVLARHGRELDGVDEHTDDLAAEQPVLASCYGASAGDVQVLGEAPGRKTDKLTGPTPIAPPPSGPVAEVGGVNVHAKVAIEAADRPRLEQLCRYTARPPLSGERLELHHDGRVRVVFKAPWKDGTHAVLLSPLDFISRLCALIPPPRFHMLRYHGVLAAGANARVEVVPGAEPDEPPQLSLLDGDHESPPPRPSRHPWPWLLRRVFSVDVTVCARCGGPMRLLSIASEPGDIDAILRGMPPRSRAPPRAHPDQLELDLSAA